MATGQRFVVLETNGIRVQEVVGDDGEVRHKALRGMDTPTKNSGTLVHLPELVCTKQMKVTVRHVHGEGVRKVGTSQDERPCTCTCTIMFQNAYILYMYIILSTGCRHTYQYVEAHIVIVDIFTNM